nr:immunoglobulin heavy chain junction region [Macaca mulatta]MOV86894.1 immunoglobulin heavy chain junction region [Macaca mulatta]MOV87582.1 immunoglobulin heavy chain junction region [Macaca mulatta]MOV88520.1 immunoglobulin heavy chain junction region [Macaca mulatta]MOV88524.1 immunoglobulin heavy chain junction region [Macaca mulatta]
CARMVFSAIRYDYGLDSW